MLFLRYANEEVFGLVMLFHQGRDEKAEAAMQNLTRKTIDAALACGGSYYLPYRPHATLQQFQKAYPPGSTVLPVKAPVRSDPEIFERKPVFSYTMVNRNSHLKFIIGAGLWRPAAD